MAVSVDTLKAELQYKNNNIKILRQVLTDVLDAWSQGQRPGDASQAYGAALAALIQILPD